MYTDNKQVRNVAEAAYKIMMGEKLHPNQQQLDVHEPEKDELTADDFKKLRGKKEVKKEEVESIEEEDTGYMDRYAVKNGKAVKDNPKQRNYDDDEPHHVYADSPEHAVRKYAKMKKPGMKKEEVEELDELSKNTLGSYIKKANFAGGMADFKHGRIADKRGDSKEKTSLAATSHKRTKGISTAVDKLSKEEVELDEVKMADLPSTKVQGRSYGASKPEPHAVDTLSGPKQKELKDIDAEKNKKKFSEMVNLYQEKGLKSLSEMLAKEETEVVAYPLDVNEINGVQISMVQEEVEQIEERHMTDDEMNKREDIVKSMKKGIAGFKERYGDRAKDVMYATATKQSMKD